MFSSLSFAFATEKSQTLHCDAGKDYKVDLTLQVTSIAENLTQGTPMGTLSLTKKNKALPGQSDLQIGVASYDIKQKQITLLTYNDYAEGSLAGITLPEEAYGHNGTFSGLLIFNGAMDEYPGLNPLVVCTSVTKEKQ